MKPIEETVYIAGDQDLDSGFAKAIALKSIATALDNKTDINNIRQLLLDSISNGANPVYESLKSGQFSQINEQSIPDSLKENLYQKVLIIETASNPFNQIDPIDIKANFDSSLNQHTLGVLNQIHIGTLQEIRNGIDIDSALNKSIDKYVVQPDTKIENEQTKLLSLGLAGQELFNQLANNPDNITFNAIYGDAINSQDMELGNGDISSITAYIENEAKQSHLIDIPPQLKMLAKMDNQIHDMGGFSIPVDEDRLTVLASNIDPETIKQSYKQAIDLIDIASNSVKLDDRKQEIDSPSI